MVDNRLGIVGDKKARRQDEDMRISALTLFKIWGVFTGLLKSRRLAKNTLNREGRRKRFGKGSNTIKAQGVERSAWLWWNAEDRGVKLV